MDAPTRIVQCVDGGAARSAPAGQPDGGSQDTCWRSVCATPARTCGMTEVSLMHGEGPLQALGSATTAWPHVTLCDGCCATTMQTTAGSAGYARRPTAAPAPSGGPSPGVGSSASGPACSALSSELQTCSRGLWSTGSATPPLTGAHAGLPSPSSAGGTTAGAVAGCFVGHAPGPGPAFRCGATNGQYGCATIAWPTGPISCTRRRGRSISGAWQRAVRRS
mmetsp:Transcript_51007/g.91235  ORF Transcript_51007/g.91235 Transcript_51007/m.91235 type:complete len:221 (-) Transcript_51007:1308-1970(-)